MLKLPAGSIGDLAAAVIDITVAINLAQVDILGVRRYAHFALGFGDAQVVGVEGQVAGQVGNLQLGDRGVQMNGPTDVFEVYIAEYFAVEGDLAFDFREGEVVAVAIGGDVAGDFVSGEIATVVGEMHLDGTLNGAQVHVAVA